MMMRQKDDMAAAFLNWKDAEAYIELQFFFFCTWLQVSEEESIQFGIFCIFD